MESEASKTCPPAGGGQAAPAKPRRLKGHKGEVTCCVVSRTRPGIVASSGEDGCICLFDLRCKDVLFTMDIGNEPLMSLCFNAGNEDVLYVSSGTEVIGYDIHMASSWKRLESYNYNKEEINQIAFNPKSPFLAAADDSGDIKIIDVRQQCLYKTLRAVHTNICSTVQFLPWKPWSAITGGLDSKLVTWDFSKGRPQNIIDFGMSSLETHEPHGNPGQCFNPPFVHSIAVSEADAVTGLDKFCAAARGDGVVEIIDIESEFVASKLKNSSDSRRRSTSKLGENRCTTGQRQKRRLQLDYGLGGHTAAVSCVCFSMFGERGKFILSGGTDALIKVWDWSKQFHAEEKSLDSHVTSTITLNRKDNGGHLRNLSSMSTVESEGNGENPLWKNRVASWKEKKTNKKKDAAARKNKEETQVPSEQQMDNKQLREAEEPLSRIIPISPNKLTPYRAVIVMRLLVLGLFFHYRLTNPVDSAYGLWLTSVICEIWFAVSWVLDQFPKWSPINRETYIDRLSSRFEKDGSDGLSAVDFFVSTVDPMKEPPLITANTVLSILAVDYPVEKVSCYVSDDGSAMLTFESLAETAEFARKWVPFCKKYSIEPRAPEFYFSQKIDYLKDKVQPSFVKERRAMKRDYEEYKVRINALVAKAQKTPDEGWIMQDGTPWPGNNPRDHPGMIQVFLGHSGAHDTDGNELPRLVYVSREKRPGYQHHKKAGAMNALVRVSAVLTNAPHILNLDCDHYVNNSKAVREAMCFMMDPNVGTDVCYVQFPQRFDGIDRSDRYANRNIVFFDVNMKGLDGIQGPVYVGTGCVFYRQALYGYGPPSLPANLPRASSCCSPSCCCTCFRRPNSAKKDYSGDDQKEIYRDSLREDLNSAIFNLREIHNYDEYERSLLISQMSFEKTFGLSPVFIESTLVESGGVQYSADPSTLIKEAIHVISCGYEEKTEWGKEIGWIYGSVTEDILTGFKMHCRGWRSIYCMPARPAFKGSAPINLSDRLHQVLRWALGSVEIFLSRHCPLWYGFGGGRLRWLQRLAYINTIVYPFTSLPLIAYCSLPAICLLTGKFIIPTLSNVASIWFLGLFISIILTSVLELRWSGVGVEDWWRNEQFWVIGGVSAHLFAVFQGFLKMLAGLDTNFTVTAKAAASDVDGAELGELYAFKWTTLLIPPTTLLVVNLVGVVAGFSDALNSGYEAWGPLLGKVFFAVWVVLHLYPFLKGLMGRQNRTPTIVVLWSVLLASVFSLLWVKVDPFLTKVDASTLAHSCISIEC